MTDSKIGEPKSHDDVPQHSTPCVFCGIQNRFIMACSGVCMDCDAKLQELGLMVRPIGKVNK